MNANQELRSLKRGLTVLTLLNQTENLSITELARHLKLPRTTAERILLTLLAEGYVQRVPDDKRYRLSSKVCSLSGGFSEDCWIVQTATPLLFHVTEQIGWPMAIATPSSDRMEVRITTDRATSLWLSRRRVGANIPMLNASSGLIAYAFASHAEQALLQQLLARSKDATNRERAANPRTLELLIQPVLDRGFAFQPPPNNNPEQSVAVPIFIHGRYVASLLMIYMTQAMTCATVVERYVPLLKTLSTRIGAAAQAHREIDLDDKVAMPRIAAPAGFLSSVGEFCG